MDTRLVALENELFAAAHRVMERDRLMRRRERLESAVAAQWERLTEAQKALEQGGAARGDFGAALGDALEAGADDEQKRRVADMLRYDQANKALADLEGHVARISKEIDALGPHAEHYNRLAEEKERLLAQQSAAEQPRALAAFLQQDRALVRQEGVGGAHFAVEVGRAAAAALDDLSAKLAHAGRVDLWDLNQDGTITREEKLAVIEAVHTAVRGAQDSLQSFESCVEDFMGLPDVDIDLDVHAFEDLSKLMLDDFYLDWIVESKAHQAQLKVKEVGERISGMLSQLDKWSRRPAP